MLATEYYGIFNIGTGDIWCNLDIIRKIDDITDNKMEFSYVEDRLGHDMMYNLDSDKLISYIGHYFTKDLETYLKENFNER
jgi:dTDP-D-glucose 4,6-dehydratase